MTLNQRIKSTLQQLSKHELVKQGLIVCSLVLLPILPGNSEAAENNTIKQALSGKHRSQKNSARDGFRHPEETLSFFGFKDDMTVVEIWPGGGWYTEVLAPAMKGKGTLYAAHFLHDTPSDYWQGLRKGFIKKMESDPLYEEVRITEFYPTRDSVKKMAPKGTVDLVLTFRNLHNWYESFGEDGIRTAFQGIYDVLKPGGVLGVVEHRMPENFDIDSWDASGYVKQSMAVKLAQSVGFTLEASSEINANPKDTADHPTGVWRLPPSLRGNDGNDAKYIAIGESDRMTLRFIKPAT